MNEPYVTLVGNVVSEVRRATTEAGVPVASFRFGSSTRRYDRAQGAWIDVDPIYVTVSCWRTMAENVTSSLGKGDPLVVHGRLRHRRYDREDGGTAYSLEIDAVALGHDLARGTGVFRRTPRRVETAGGSDVAGELAAGLAEEEPA
ncbi:MAG: single-stranded DNA-binding protein, partial [Actinomycetes bacterium]